MAMRKKLLDRGWGETAYMTAWSSVPLYLVSTVLQSFHGFSPSLPLDYQAISNCERRFFEKLGIEDEHLTSLSQADLPIEVLALRGAVGAWLDKKKPILMGPDALSDLDFQAHPLESMASHCFYTRLQQAPATIESMREEYARAHESDELLALAWAEIWYALDNKIRVRVCSYCSTVFRVPKNNPQTHHCGSKECKRQYLIDSHGGPEGYRAWETERKKKSKKQMGPGRPRKDGKQRQQKAKKVPGR
ncbi:MAG TPA: hypothetical protein VMW83_05425 [Spirochaetia bacterium]|nr:hypothetical protein [Spirochaetia bacterium]